MLELH